MRRVAVATRTSKFPEADLGWSHSFHEAVDEDLKKRKADVIEFYQPLTSAMDDIQTAIVDCMEATLTEIKRSNHYVSARRHITKSERSRLIAFARQLDVEELTFENSLFRSFDSLVRAQLDQVWHKVGAKTKGLVSDLTTLRKLQTCVVFCFQPFFATDRGCIDVAQIPSLDGLGSFPPVPRDSPVLVHSDTRRPRSERAARVARNSRGRYDLQGRERSRVPSKTGNPPRREAPRV